jgi:hypothetical protein
VTLTIASLARALTPRRIRVHATLLALCLWGVYAINLSAPGLRDRNGLIKGTDFFYFYTIGAAALHGRGDLLYNTHGLAGLAGRLVPGSAGTLYLPLYGPQVSLFFAPFATLPYLWSLAIWLALNTVIYLACVWAIWKACPNLQAHKWTVLVAALAFPAFVHLLAWGQTSGLALACFTLAYLAFRAQRPWLAGLTLGCLIFKPQLALAAVVVMLLSGEWKVFLGAAISAAAQLAVGWIHYGRTVMRAYALALIHVTHVMGQLEPRPYQTYSLRTFWSMLLPWPRFAFGIYLVSALLVLFRAWKSWQSKQPLPLRYPVLLLATVLVSPHLSVYDLVILAPAFLLLADFFADTRHASPAGKLLIYLCYPLVLVGPFARITHTQIAVIALAALLWITYNQRGVGVLSPAPGRQSEVPL